MNISRISSVIWNFTGVMMNIYFLVRYIYLNKFYDIQGNMKASKMYIFPTIKVSFLVIGIVNCQDLSLFKPGRPLVGRKISSRSAATVENFCVEADNANKKYCNGINNSAPSAPDVCESDGLWVCTINLNPVLKLLNELFFSNRFVTKREKTELKCVKSFN